MAKKGQRSPYSVWFAYPDQTPSTFTQTSLPAADRFAREAAGRGATALVLMRVEDGRRFRLFTYRPDDLPEMSRPEGMQPQQEAVWIADWYRRHGEPAEVRPRGVPLPLKTAQLAAAPSPTAALVEPEFNPVGDALQTVLVRESARTSFGPGSPVVLKAGLDVLGLQTEGTTENGDYIVTPAALAELVKLALRAPKDH